MTFISAYLTFGGNCRHAMNFYKECLGGELSIQTIADSPMSDKIPEKIGEGILHSSLIKEGLIIMASDMTDEKRLIRGNSVSLMLNCSSEEEIRIYYSRLSCGGRATHPLENTFWGALFGDLTDKFGIHWLLNYNKGGQPN